MRLQASMICLPGEAQGDVLFLDDPLSFWGGFDPITGVIVDQHHPQRGQSLTGRMLVLPETRGSGGTPGGMAEALRLETAPAGIILSKPDINLTVGAQVAAKLYGRSCPIAVVPEPAYQGLRTCHWLSINRDGSITGKDGEGTDGPGTL